MLKDEYLKQVERLKDAFGEKGFTNEKIQTLWERIKDADPGVWEKVVTNEILNNYNPPPLSVFVNAVKIHSYSREEKATFNFDCSWCGQSGAVAVINKKTNYKAAFLCTCEWFKDKLKTSMLIPWEDEYRLNWEPEFYCFQNPGEKPYKIVHKPYKPNQEQKDAYKKIYGSAAVF
jgi:hypothetical protein